MKIQFALAATVIGSLVIQGCSQHPSVPAEPLANPAELASEPPAALPPRPFPPETLYALLVAEMAGSRERYDYALGNYIQQAHKTRDPGITARATRIARFLKAHQPALNSALLWLQLEPENSEARLIAASELAHSGRLIEAFEHSRYLLENGSTPVFQSLAARAAATSDEERAGLLEQYQELLQKYPQELQLLVGQGLLLQQQRQFPQALAAAQLALKTESGYIPAAILEAKLLHQLNRPNEALHRLHTLLAQHPDNKRLRLQYARLLASFDLDKAHEQFSILVDQSPDDTDLLFSLALVSNERGLTDLAREQFEILLASGKRTSSAHYYLGRIAQQQQQWQTALSHYQNVEAGPDYLPAVLQITEIQIRNDNADAAHTHLNTLRQRYPSQAERFYLMESEVLARHSHFDRAEQVLSTALTQAADSTRLLYARAMINEKRDFIELMETDLRTILKSDPNNATALNALGYTLADRTDRLAEAHDLISQAFDLNPDDPAIMDSMGWVQFRLGNYDEALLRLRQAMQAFPDHEIAAHLGEVLWLTGKRSEARATFTEGLKLNPSSDIIPSVLKRLGAELEQTPPDGQTLQ